MAANRPRTFKNTSPRMMSSEKQSSSPVPQLILTLLHFLSPISSLFTTTTTTPKKSRNLHRHHHLFSSFSLLFLSLLCFFSISALLITLTSHNNHIPTIAFSPSPCRTTSPPPPPLSLGFLDDVNDDSLHSLSRAEIEPLPSRGDYLASARNVSEAEKEFWRQPDGEGYKPCLDFGIDYRRESVGISKEKRRFLVAVVSGGLNQQRNQIVDAVVIARILKAALVVPVLQVNLIWGDDSEFSDIFDVEHFKRVLKADVRVVSSLPSSHLVSRQSIETQLPFDVSPLWIRSRFSKQLNEEGFLVLKGLDSKLSKNLPRDLQKLRCKVAFHALRFARPIRTLGARLARRMWIEGPYIATHLRLEKDVWVRTGCRSGLGKDLDLEIARDRANRPEYLTGRVNMSHWARRLAGLCPLNAGEVARLLKALGAPRTARIYVAGGEPFGGFRRATASLEAEFPNLIRKEALAKDGELEPFVNRQSALAALDYVVALSSDVFVPSHGGNMGRAIQGHRAYTGHRKYIKPNKRMMLPFFEDKSITEAQFNAFMKKLHSKSMGQVEPRLGKRYRDVLAYPVPECMCRS